MISRIRGSPFWKASSVRKSRVFLSTISWVLFLRIIPPKHSLSSTSGLIIMLSWCSLLMFSILIDDKFGSLRSLKFTGARVSLHSISIVSKKPYLFPVVPRWSPWICFRMSGGSNWPNSCPFPSKRWTARAPSSGPFPGIKALLLRWDWSWGRRRSFGLSGSFGAVRFVLR